MQEFARLFEQVDLNTPHCIYCCCLDAVDESVAATDMAAEIIVAEERPQGEEGRVLGFWVPGAEVSRRSQRGYTGHLGTVYELWVERRNGTRDSVVACSTCLRKSPQCTINPARDTGGSCLKLCLQHICCTIFLRHTAVQSSPVHACSFVSSPSVAQSVYSSTGQHTRACMLEGRPCLFVL